MTRALLTNHSDDPDDDPPDERALLRQAFADAVCDVQRSAERVASAQAEHAARVERARVAAIALGACDRSTGGPRWSPEVVIERIVVTELAAALRLSEFDARRQVETARALAGEFGATRLALEQGHISFAHAERLVRYAAALPPECIVDYEARLLPIARRVSAQRLERHARAAVEEAQPTTAVERHLRAAATRRLTLDPAADGMAYLTQFLPAVEAVAIYNRATDLAKSLKNAGDTRTMTQLRVDAVCDLLLNGESSVPGAARGIRPHVTVTVPALTLISGSGSGSGTGSGTGSGSGTGESETHDAGPAMLDGYGPIDRLTALTLTREAPSFYRVLTDPASGVALTYGRTRYKPPVELDVLIRTIHAECSFPIDCRSSGTADLDHTQPFAEGGETALGNLAPLCSSHHKVKHHTEWSVRQHPGSEGMPGTIVWTSPAGFEYVVDPTPIARPVPHFARQGDDGAPTF